MLTAEIQGPSKWELIYRGKHRRGVNDVRLQIDLPMLLTSPFVLVAAISYEAKPRWRWAGDLIQYAQNIDIDDRLVYPGLGQPSQVADLESRWVKLNQIQRLIFSPEVAQYYLFFDALPWIKSLELDIWEYRGETGEYTANLLAGQLETIKIDLLRIETLIRNNP